MQYGTKPYLLQIYTLRSPCTAENKPRHFNTATLTTRHVFDQNTFLAIKLRYTTESSFCPGGWRIEIRFALKLALVAYIAAQPVLLERRGLETGVIVRHETLLTGQSFNRMKEHWRVASSAVESGQVFERYESLTERQLQVCDGRVDSIQHCCRSLYIPFDLRWLVGDWTEAGRIRSSTPSIPASQSVLLTGCRDLRSVRYSHDHKKQLPLAPSRPLLPSARYNSYLDQDHKRIVFDEQSVIKVIHAARTRTNLFWRNLLMHIAAR
jgi:hypothetical protein